MPTLTLRSNDLRQAISNTLPILKRNDYLPVLDQARFIVEGGGLHLVSTDRFIALANPVPVSEVEDKRRANVGLNADQLKVAKAWLTHLPSPFLRVRITNEAVTFESIDGNTLRLGAVGGTPVDVMKLIRDGWDKETALATPDTPKVWNPVLVKHLPGVKLYSSGATMKMGLFTADGGAFGIIMPMSWNVETGIEHVKRDNADLFAANGLAVVPEPEDK